MNNSFLKWIFGLLGFSTIATSCEEIIDDPKAMYGCPSADYVFNVDVIDGESEAPIEGIRVSAVVRGERQYWDSESNIAQYEQYIDTLAVGRTSADGKVVLQYGEFPLDKHEIVADDVDGADNGAYNSSSVVLTIDREDYKEGGNSGWYLGTATENITLKLSKKNE